MFWSIYQSCRDHYPIYLQLSLSHMEARSKEHRQARCTQNIGRSWTIKWEVVRVFNQPAWTYVIRRESQYFHGWPLSVCFFGLLRSFRAEFDFCTCYNVFKQILTNCCSFCSLNNTWNNVFLLFIHLLCNTNFGSAVQYLTDRWGQKNWWLV